MPTRHLALTIVFFWLATSAWLFYRDFWPRWRSGDAPPFSIDLAYEAQKNASDTSWRILRGDKHLGFIHTKVQYDGKSDTFELSSGPVQANTAPQLDMDIGPLKIRVSELISKYRVSREGLLRGTKGSAHVDIQGRGIARALHLRFELDARGEVKNGLFIPYASVTWEGQKYDLQLEPVPYTTRDSFLNPLHPVSRLAGLRRGQHWQLTNMNPLADSVAAMAQKDPALQLLVKKNAQMNVLQAEVLPETQILTYDSREVVCLVIEYRSDEMTAHTWVRESDGKVLRQEVSLWGERLVLERL
jgi:hypothetical protein